MTDEPPLNANSTLQKKVSALFLDLLGERGKRLHGLILGTDITNSISAALQEEFGSERAEEIAFHVADWGSDAAFIVALHLFPEHFDSTEIHAGVDSLLWHVPNHAAAAAVLSGHSVKDVFGVMLPGLLATSEAPLEFVEFTRPDLLADGYEPEQRVVHHGLSWERYLALDKMFGDDRPGPRFCYLDGVLEIVTTSAEHERIKGLLHGFIGDCFERKDIHAEPYGHATIRIPSLNVGIDPDDSWYGAARDDFPELVFEVMLNGGGVDKLELYRRFTVPEVWFWRRGALEVYTLRVDGTGYDLLPASSRLMPELDTALLQHCVALRDWHEARRTFRAGMKF